MAAEVMVHDFFFFCLVILKILCRIILDGKTKGGEGGWEQNSTEEEMFRVKNCRRQSDGIINMRQSLLGLLLAAAVPASVSGWLLLEVLSPKGQISEGREMSHGS